MKTTLALTALLFLSGALATAAEPPAPTDLNKTALAWHWTQGSAGAAEYFRVKCGKAAGAHTLVTTLSSPDARSVPLVTVITGSGLWYCVVTAVNTYGESPPSNEIFFDAGAAPSAPTDTHLEATTP